MANEDTTTSDVRYHLFTKKISPITRQENTYWSFYSIKNVDFIQL